MKDNSPNSNQMKPLSLTSQEIDKILSMTLIAKLATLDYEGGIHIVPMWFIHIDNDICIPTSRHTRKYKNLQLRPQASVMVDISHEGLNLKGGPSRAMQKSWKVRKHIRSIVLFI